MRNFRLAPILFACAMASACAEAPTTRVHRIAFGSCIQQGRPAPVLETAAGLKPDLFILLGDNIYADTTDMDAMRAKYAALKAKPEFQRLSRTCPLLATWDDHDYGENDAGAEYSAKKASQSAFLDFLSEPADSPRRRQEGVYSSCLLGPPEERIQVILLDTRYFRSPLARAAIRREGQGPYESDTDPEKTLLGEEQWRWLETQLRVPARLRILASSIQVVAREHAWERWDEFPRERERLYDLIRQTGAEGVLVISGDRHHGELSRDPEGAGYPLIDLTSSSLNQPGHPNDEPNRFRVGPRVRDSNVGLIEVDWSRPNPHIRLALLDVDGATRVEHVLDLDELRFPR